MRHVLKIEYEYNRVYLNSLALQAVVERCISNTPMQAHASLNGISGVNSKRGMKTDGGAIPLQILHKYYGPDRHYISEVSSACREVLKVLVDGLYPGDFLKHAPVRTYFRIISVSIILLKVSNKTMCSIKEVFTHHRIDICTRCYGGRHYDKH